MNFVEKHSKLLAVALCLCASGPVLSTVHAYEVQPGWHSNGEVSYYVQDNHQKATGLVEIEDETYYFNQNGEMQRGWQNIDNETYYFDNNGQAVTGKTEIQGTTYNFQQEGTLMQGWSEDGTYNNEKGFKVTNAWVNEEDGRYYTDENGNPVKSAWLDIEGNRYYFDENGRVAVGEINVDGVTYYTDDQGIVRTGWADQDGVRYFYNEDGSKNMDAYRDIDGVLYAFNEDGSLMTNSERDGYIIDENGVATEKPVEAPAVETPVETPSVEAPAETPAETPAAPVVDPGYTEVVDTVVPETPAPSEDVIDTEPGAVTPGDSSDSVVVEPQPEAPAPVPTPTPEPLPTPTPTPDVNNDKASAILAAAMAQLGVNQDCTMLVTNSLAAVGIYFHDWPEGYLSLGDLTSNPVPGDIIVYSGHVAIYAGNGQAVHGGWNGYTTVLNSVSCGQALIGYVHVR